MQLPQHSFIYLWPILLYPTMITKSTHVNIRHTTFKYISSYVAWVIHLILLHFPFLGFVLVSIAQTGNLSYLLLKPSNLLGWVSSFNFSEYKYLTSQDVSYI